MSSIYITAAGFLRRRPNTYKEADLHHTVPLLVCNRGLFDCIAPRLTQIYHAYSPRTVMIAANACTFHLTREANLAMHYNQDVPATMAVLRKFTQVAALTLFREESLEVDMSSVSIELTRFAPTLTKLDIACFTYHVTDADLLATAIAELRNLRELHIRSLTPALCTALAAGPGPRLCQMSVHHQLHCQPLDVDVLVAGCPNVLRLDVSGCSFDLVPSASKLPYLEHLHASMNDSPAENDMRTAFSNMARLTKLCITFTFSRLTDEVSSAMAAIIANTVGPQLVDFTLSSRTFSSDAFAELCCASSFPQLQRLSLNCHGGCIVERDVAVSLSPVLTYLSLEYFTLSPRTRKQLLTNKPQLREILLVQSQSSFPFFGLSNNNNNGNTNNNDQVSPVQTPAPEDDWFGQLARIRLRTLHIDGTALPASMDTSIASLSRTLRDVTIDVDGWPVLTRDPFLSLIFSRCVLLEYFTAISLHSMMFPGLIASRAIDAKVAFAGLRNNERILSLDMPCNIRSPNALVEELLAMRSTDLKYLQLDSVKLAVGQCIALAERFVFLESLRSFSMEQTERQVLEQRFPRVQWR